MIFAKYHALGNDYLILPPTGAGNLLSPEVVQRICQRHTGVGCDGILFGPLETRQADFALRIFNPDGSQAEKSGNGLRIFARYLWDQGLVQEQEFTILTPGGKVACRVHAGGQAVTVDMGRVSFDSRRIPVLGPPREVINETIVINGQELLYCAATLGNPHCVIFQDEISSQETRRLGPLIEREARFPNRTNVQFARVIDRANLQIEIWERGAGYTLASGSSSCAVAASAYLLGLCQAHVNVHMPGGCLEVAIADGWSVTLTGPVAPICHGVLHSDLLAG
jgi:diaminopimelate epimerase